MLYLLDTGVILRIFNSADPQHGSIRKAVRHLRHLWHRLVLSTQNIAEFWNVSTRPSTTRGGYGLSLEQTDRRLKILERFCDVLSDAPNLYPTWRQLLVDHQVRGVQVHDARLAAWMGTLAITHIVTLNASDFLRYRNVVALSPTEALALV